MVSKALCLNLNISFLNWISLLLISSSYRIVLTRLGGPVPDLILPETFLGYSRESNPGPLGCQSDVLTTVPNRWSPRIIISVNIHNHINTRISINGVKIPNYKFKWILANISIIDIWTKFDRAVLKRHLSSRNTEVSLIEEKNL